MSQQVMPWRIEDQLKALGANHVQAGMWKGFAICDGNLVRSRPAPQPPDSILPAQQAH